MHGLFGTYGQSVRWDLSQYAQLLARKAVTGPVCIEQRTLNKFVDDKPFVDTPDYCYALEGVLFGPTTDLAVLYEQYGETFMRQLRGSFSGFFYDKKQDILLVFTDHIGDKMLFYYHDDFGTVFSSDLDVLTIALADRCSRTLNKRFCWGMLTYGFSPVAETPIVGIHRLQGGEYVRISSKGLEKKRFHLFQTGENSLSIDENIRRFDALFRQALQRVLNKNKQYGLTNLFALSAGLDSRMAVCVARHLDDVPLDVFTYSQTGYFDQTIPQSIAQAWNCRMHFSALDGGEHLQHIDQVNLLTNGLVNYSGGSEAFFHTPLYENTGVITTGMLGDIVPNSHYSSDRPYWVGQCAISSKYLSQLKAAHPELKNRYANYEQYFLYVRAFSCANLGAPLVLQQQGESYSPFYDVDVLEFSMTIPKQQRYAYLMYDRWIKTLYPEATQWLHNGKRQIGQRPKTITLWGRTYPPRELMCHIIWYICKRLHIYDFYRQQVGESMDPEDAWISHNPALKHCLDQYVSNHLSVLSEDADIQQKSLTLYKEGTAMEKFNVISLLAAVYYAQR